MRKRKEESVEPKVIVPQDLVRWLCEHCRATFCSFITRGDLPPLSTCGRCLGPLSIVEQTQADRFNP